MAVSNLERSSGLPNRRAYIVFGVIAAAFLLSSINGTIVAVALPTMLIELHTSLAWVGWTLTGFMLAQSVVMPVAGKLSDDWGARRVFLGSVALFTFSSILAGFAPNVYVLIVARMLQALGTGAMLPSATSIVSDTFGERRSTAIGLFTTIFPLGGVLGPSVGGFVIDHFSWRWMFYANGPVGIAVLVIGLFLIPRGLRLPQRGKVDVIGIGLFSGGLLSILGAMTVWGNDPQSVQQPFTWAAVLFGFAALVVFFWHEGRTLSPVVDIQLIRGRPYFAANLYSFLFGASVFGFGSFIPYYATLAYGMSAGESGLVLAPRFGAMAIASTVSSFFLIRRGYRFTMIIGVVLNSVSLLLLSPGFHDISLLNLLVPNTVLLSLIVLLTGIGMGISGPASNNAVLDLVPDRVAAAVGLRGMFRATGGVFGTAVIILILSHSEDKVAGMQAIFVGFGLFTLLALPVVLMIPDAARQKFVAARKERQRGKTSAQS
ncbi:MAG: MFS transporter [Dehalococcoidia bacterium]|nr:MFS transporter [Dehalococcoidia bacterium]